MNEKALLMIPSIKTINKSNQIDDKTIEKGKKFLAPNLKLSDVYKNMFSSGAGVAIKNIVSGNVEMAVENSFSLKSFKTRK
jgi:hypothetical protein